ncbi:MAG: formylglycine-generating enzyme family protein [Proteobacteria bacterium]|nr:formylglycine-generating enzyme family protein [Pseudomonadota bacterium]MBU1714041.1 formylglycine-generating enzyme family protein [Pseudomonadota bacterium]
MGKMKWFLSVVLLGLVVMIALFLVSRKDDQPVLPLQSVPAAENYVEPVTGKDDQPDLPLQSGPASENYVDLVTGMDFVWIDGGCFEMGSPDDEQSRKPDEGPVHQVCVDGFYMGKYEVTNRQYQLFNGKHVSRNIEGYSFNGEEQPVTDVSWDDAMAYIEWLNRESGKTFRLPTEAEWEYAARAGSKTSRFWGDSPDDACMYGNIADITANTFWSDWTIHNCDDGYIVTAPVGQFKPNAFGLYDMVGNVWEWTGDWYGKDYYENSPMKNPQGPLTGDTRVVRGTPWDDNPGDERSAKRLELEPNYRGQYNGFRLVLPSAK